MDIMKFYPAEQTQLDISVYKEQNYSSCLPLFNCNEFHSGTFTIHDVITRWLDIRKAHAQ